MALILNINRNIVNYFKGIAIALLILISNNLNEMTYTRDHDIYHNIPYIMTVNWNR